MKRFILRLIGIVVLAATLTRAGNLMITTIETCDGGISLKMEYDADPHGPQRVSLAHMVTMDSEGVRPDEQYIEVGTTRVDLLPDTVLTLFYQTDPSYRAMLGPNDTWLAFSGDRLAEMDGFVSFSINFSHNTPFQSTYLDTRFVQFSLVPHTYADTPALADSVSSHLRFQLADGVTVRNALVDNTFMATANGRVISHAGGIPSDPPGALPTDTVYWPKAGDLVITEIMADPNNGVADATGEWFEVENVSGVILNLDPVTIRDNGSDFFMNPRGVLDMKPPVLLPPGQRAVFGNSNDPRTNGGARVHINYGHHVTLANNADEIILEVPGVGVIDRVDYTSTWNLPSGKSIELVDTTADNNVSSNWTAATQSFGPMGQKGTPGSFYNVAAVDPPIGDPGVAPTPGSLRFTELHTAPWGHDDGSEWFEIFNPLDTPVNLTDLVVEMTSDTGVVQSFRITEDVILNARSYLVFTRNDDLNHGGLPMGYPYKGSFSLYNDVGTLRMTHDSAVIDELDYNGKLYTGFPDYGDGVDGSWPMPSEYDGRTVALQGTLAQLRDTAGYNDNVGSNWALTDGWRHNAFGFMLVATPGAPNIEELSLSVSGGPSTIDARSADTFRVTITPPTGYGVNDIDTQSIRLFWRQKPLFLKIGASSIEADFRRSDAPWQIERNLATTAHLTARFNGDSPMRFGGTWSTTVEDTAAPTPAATSTPSPGDLKITEIMVNAAGNENDYEYVELYNTTTNKTFNLLDLGIQDGGGTTSDPTPEGRSRLYNRNNRFPVRLGPGQYAVLGQNHTNHFLGLNATATYINPDVSFSNTGDQVVIYRLADNVAIAEVDFEPASAGFPNQNTSTVDGRSMSLIDVNLDPSKGANWINATIPYRNGTMALPDTSYGTPGAPNRIANKAGSVIVTEVFPNPPPGGEPNAEFFEVYNPDTSGPVDLAGLVVTDDAQNTFAISDKPGLTVSGGPQSSYIPAGGVFVFGNSRGAADGVDSTFSDTFGIGITKYDYPNSWTLTNTSDAVRLVRYRANGESTAIHGMAYTSTTEGKSWALSNLADTRTYSLRQPNPTVVP